MIVLTFLTTTILGIARDMIKLGLCLLHLREKLIPPVELLLPPFEINSSGELPSKIIPVSKLKGLACLYLLLE